MRISGSEMHIEAHLAGVEAPDASAGVLVPTGGRALARSKNSGRSPEVERSSTDGSTSLKPDAKRQGTSDTVELQKLSQSDVAVRQRQQALLAATGWQARGGRDFEYRLGPDGRLYAVGTGVILDVSAATGAPLSPATRRELIGRSALAPRQPSVQDYEVASRGSYEIFRTRLELMGQERRKTQEAHTVMIPPKGTLIDLWV